MNQIAEDISQDDEIAAPLTVVSEPNTELIRPEYKFRGQPLWPYTLGTRIIFNQAVNINDKMMFIWPAFVFMLIRRGEKTAAEDRKKHLLPLWESGDLRSAIVDWADELTDSDLLEAKAIYDKWQTADASTKVEPVPIRGRHMEKKTQRRRKHSLSISSGAS